MKRQKRLVTGVPKRPVHAASPPPQATTRVRVNDPLAIGIEALERSFWPSARGRSYAR